MILVKLLGLIDLTGAFLHILVKWDFGASLGLIFGTLLLVKGLVFFKNFASIIDIASAIFLLLAFFGVYSYLNLIFALWLAQKAFFSLI